MAWSRLVIDEIALTGAERCLMNKTVYYLPGRGGQITTGLGEGLRERGCLVVGRETLGAFRRLSFQEQITTVKNDLRDHFWNKDGRIVAVSYGAYLFLHAQAQMQPFPGKVLLLSPIIGQFSGDEVMIGFVPPMAKLLKQLAVDGSFNGPIDCQIHVGENDWQSNPPAVSEFGSRVGMDVHVVPESGHQLGARYVGVLLDHWLK